MSRLPPSPAEVALEHVAEQFTQWRQTRAKGRERIPGRLWGQAVSLTHRLPISRVAKRLGLGLSDLKKRRAVTDTSAPAHTLDSARPAPGPHADR